MNLENEYLLWQLVAGKHTFRVSRFDTAFLKRSAGSLSAVWPAGAFCVLEADPGAGDPHLPDCLWNKDRRLLISPRLKNVLSQAAGPDAEYWPLKIIDGTGRTLGDPYFFLHLLNAPNCLDLEACGATRSRILPGMAEKVERLIFKSDPARPLFCPSTFNSLTLVSWPLADTIAGEGFSGFRFMGLFDYGMKGDLPPHPGRHKVDALCNRNFESLGNRR